MGKEPPCKNFVEYPSPRGVIRVKKLMSVLLISDVNTVIFLYQCIPKRRYDNSVSKQ